ncbi:MAG: molecular chaperone DnaJ [Parcubacteria group bacterium CG1_02_58_44]|nr:MAG: molecular chaperone DnaJ [Parcubacteria group bacterium CG1_02_58_44]
MKDYYDILGVQRNASSDDIKRAFRKLAHQHHPDKAGGDAEKFKEINRAYQTLGDEKKRTQYDQLGYSNYEQMGSGGGPGPGGFDFSGFRSGGAQGFDFGDIFGGGGRSGRQAEKRGRHIEMDLPLTFEEAAFGVSRTIGPHRTVTCPDCEGTGAEKGTALKSCSECGGSGQVRTVQQTIIGNFQSTRTCSRCQGDGKLPEKPCGTCSGGGVVRRSKNVEVSIPAGIGDGEVLRVSGEGEAVKGGRSGDLYLTVRMKRHPKFEREGFDVHSEEEVSFPQAALGTKVDVSTLDGDVSLKIPAGTQSSTVMRLKGKGVPFLKGTGRGDHYVTVRVAVPTKLTRQQRKALEDWGE